MYGCESVVGDLVGDKFRLSSSVNSAEHVWERRFRGASHAVALTQNASRGFSQIDSLAEFLVFISSAVITKSTTSSLDLKLGPRQDFSKLSLGKILDT